MKAEEVIQQLLLHATSERAKANQWFFKTDPGQYGAGDKFMGVTVPNIRLVAKQFVNLDLKEIEKLLHNSTHEVRLIALIILVNQYKMGNVEKQQKIYEFYLAQTEWINNWDLVDCSAAYIVGNYLLNKSKNILVTLAKSENIWERRISVVATFAFIKNNNPRDALKIIELLLHDSHDLIHKASGWMLREVGKNCGLEIEEAFLRKHYKIMPRTMLRYAIEKFSEEKKVFYMKK